SIAQNTALFALIGTTYGGDGQTTFALPDLRSRIPIGMQGGNIGASGGTETVTLTTQTNGTHSHPATCGGNGSQASPLNGYWATDPGGTVAGVSNQGPNAVIAPDALTPRGLGKPAREPRRYVCVL